MEQAKNLLPPKVSLPELRSPSNGGSASANNDKLIAASISTLMSHYWTAADSPEIRSLQMDDWLNDLGDYPAMFVTEACKRWRETQTHRPTPADIIRLTREAKDRWDQDHAPRHGLVGAAFPSLEHRESLRLGSGDGTRSFKSLSEDERAYWYAYMYGQWIVYELGEPRFDPDRKYKNAQLIDQAVEFWRGIRFGQSRGAVGITAKEQEAAEVRERWAQDHGCDSFKQALAIGLQLIGRRDHVAEAAVIAPEIDAF